MDGIGTALIGLGKVADTHAQAFASLPESTFVGVYDPLPDRTSAFAASYGVRGYGSLEELLADERVGMVSVCTPHPTHAAVSIAASSAGKHVLVEKPMAIRLEDCDAMIGAAAAHEVLLGVVSQRRLYEPVERVHEAIVSGRIGTPILGTLTVLGWRSEDYYTLDPWRGTWAGEGGGLLVTQLTHHLDLFQWLLGPITELFAYWDNLNHPSIEVEDSAVAVLRLANGGLGAIVASNSQNPGLYGRIHVHGRNGASVGVQVESGSAFISGVTTDVEPPLNDLWTIPGEEGRLAEWQQADIERAGQLDIMTAYHRRQIEDVLRAIAEGRPPMVSGEEGRKSVELFTAIYRSQATHAPVLFPVPGEA